jgi:quercetin dioxygenase-like cupin family protein
MTTIDIEKCGAGDHLPHIQASVTIAGDIGGMAMPCFVKKTWGFELIYRNTPQYCMKMLYMNAGGSTSMHFHVDKHETLLVTQGALKITTLFNKEEKAYTLTPGMAWVMCQGYAHKLEALEDVILIEASTEDFDDDSVRIQ